MEEHRRSKSKESKEEDGRNVTKALPFNLADDQGLVLPLVEPERFVHYRRRQRRLTYPVSLVASEPTSPGSRVKKEEPEIMAELRVRDVAILRPTNVTSCIQKPEAGGSDTYILAGMNVDYVRLTLFPFSLLGEAKRWLNSEPTNSITTWNDLAHKFFIRFFPSGKTAKLRSDILSFRQKVGENLYQSWDRFKSMLMSCPHHHQSNEVLVHTFIERLEPNTKILLDSTVGGQALEKTYAELFTLLNRISQGNLEWNGGGIKPVIQKMTGMLEVNVVTALTVQIATMQNMRNTHFNNLALGQQPAHVNVVQQSPSWCEICGGGDHSAEELAPKKRNIDVVNKESEPKEGEVVAQEEIMQPIVKPPPLFPQKFKKQKKDECFGKFLSLLKQVHINLLLVDVLQGIPRYTKYVKAIVANKMRLTEYETVALTEECSSRTQNKLPTKLKDSGSFTVQITIGQSIYAQKLCNLGASINLMPTSLHKKLGLGSPIPTTIILQLADRSVARPEGVVDDVLVQIGSLIFPVDFVVLNFEQTLRSHSS
ncbi:uncharacterized protein LOC125868401 [Solanum stenotomum]|uniref:uncharacterized protein LOC125868401 n=1 Tax=Solanum stenotomum TaxID=172797 RepID=UPI0020D0EB87|nr:uncharacterized protein LOC125868401 [Solanum stenotomum]